MLDVMRLQMKGANVKKKMCGVDKSRKTRLNLCAQHRRIPSSTQCIENHHALHIRSLKRAQTYSE